MLEAGGLSALVHSLVKGRGEGTLRANAVGAMVGVVRCMVGVVGAWWLCCMVVVVDVWLWWVHGCMVGVVGAWWVWWAHGCCSDSLFVPNPTHFLHGPDVPHGRVGQHKLRNQGAIAQRGRHRLEHSPVTAFNAQRPMPVLGLV